jgi:hypothetical protein
MNKKSRLYNILVPRVQATYMGIIHQEQLLASEVVGAVWIIISIAIINTPTGEWPLFLGSGVFLITYGYILDIFSTVVSWIEESYNDLF